MRIFIVYICCKYSKYTNIMNTNKIEIRKKQ